MNSIFGTRTIGGFSIDFFGFDKDKEQILYSDGCKVRKAKRHYVCPFGGNPFPGTLLEYYNIVLPNGKHARYNIYV